MAAAAAALALGAPALAQDAPPTVAAAGQEDAEDEDATVEAVVVTAGKRAENLQDVASSVTALSGDTLEERGISEFADYLAEVPGLSTFSGGAPGFGQVILRGVSTGSQQTSAAVGFYIDETPFTSSSSLAVAGTLTPDPDLTDIDRIEVLRGPQGTLYGASSLGGLIKIVSRKPDLDDYEGELRLEGGWTDGGGPGFAGRGLINIPLVTDRAGLRLAAFHRERGGYSDNVRTGEEDVNATRASGARVNLRLRPDPRLDLDVNGFFQTLEADGPSVVDLDPVTLQPLFGDLGYSALRDTEFRAEYRLFNVTAAVDLGFADLVSATSLSRSENETIADYTPAYGFILASVPGSAVIARVAPETDKFTQEFRLASRSGKRVEWITGLFYTKEDSFYETPIRGVVAATGAPLPGPLNNVYTTEISSRFREAAAFGDLTYYFTPEFDLTAGARISKNEQDFIAPTSGLLNGNVFQVRNNQSEDESTTYLFSARWRPNDDLSLYARAASGYRPGGPQISTLPGLPTTFGADTLWNYEVGAKGSLFDDRLRGDIALYHIDWSDIQLNQLVGGRTVLSNAGEATSRGVEVSARGSPLEDLSVGVVAAWNDTELQDVPAGVTAVTGARAGDPLPFSPEWTLGLTADYERPLSAVWSAVIGGSYSFQGERFSSFSGPTTNTNILIPSYETVDLRAGVRSDAFDLMLRVDNLMDERGITSLSVGRVLATQNLPASAVLIRPRTLTLALTGRF